MIHINLLPWREQARKERQIRFGVRLAASVFVGLLCIVALHLYYHSLIKHQQSRNTYLENILNEEESKLSVLNKKKREQIKILNQLNFIFNLKNSSFEAVRILDELVRVVPEGISFTTIIRNGKTITLTGKAKSNTQITLLMEKIANSPVFYQPVLTGISGDESTTNTEKVFQLKMETENSQVTHDK